MKEVSQLPLDEVTTQSVPDRIQQQLIDFLRSGLLGVSDRLPPERDLAVTLGVSRTTLRDALRGLSEKGVLEARQGSGWFVRRNKNQVVESIALYYRLEDMTFSQMVEARVAIEPTITGFAADRRTDEDLAAITDLADRMKRCRNHTEYLNLDYEFHCTIGDSAHNPFFGLAIRPMFSLLEDFRLQLMGRPETKKESMAEHQAILEGIQNQDAVAAKAAMQMHLENFQRRGLQRQPAVNPTNEAIAAQTKGVEL